MVTGDFNGETGKRNDFDKYLANFSQGTRHKNCQHIVNFCIQHNVKISNTYFHHKKKKNGYMGADKNSSK